MYERNRFKKSCTLVIEATRALARLQGCCRLLGVIGRVESPYRETRYQISVQSDLFSSSDFADAVVAAAALDIAQGGR